MERDHLSLESFVKYMYSEMVDVLYMHCIHCIIPKYRKSSISAFRLGILMGWQMLNPQANEYPHLKRLYVISNSTTCRLHRLQFSYKCLEAHVSFNLNISREYHFHTSLTYDTFWNLRAVCYDTATPMRPCASKYNSNCSGC